MATTALTPTEAALTRVLNARHARADANGEFDQAIRDAHQVDGVSLAMIAAAAGLTRARIHQIVQAGA